MGKKGEISVILKPLRDIIILMLILGVLFWKIQDIVSSESLEKKYLSKDIGILVNTLYAAPNDVVYFYTETEFPLSIAFEKSKVTVFSGADAEADYLSEDYYFFEDESVEFRYATIHPQYIETNGEQVPHITLGFKRQFDYLEPEQITMVTDLLGK